MNDLTQREFYQEKLDDPSIPLEERKNLLTQLDVTNRKFGCYKQFLRHFEKWFLKNGFQRQHGSLRILELGAGSGGLVRELSRWATDKKINFDFHIIDMDPDVLAWVKADLKSDGIAVTTHLSGSTHLAQFKSDEFDFVYSIHVLHHIQPLRILKEALEQTARVARLGVFMVDYDRRPLNVPLGYFWRWIFNIDKEIGLDGHISLLRAYKGSEVIALTDSEKFSHWKIDLRKLVFFPYFILTLQK